ncbi:hypothetical protein Q31a_39190 [Aureliella helgolandensis]|uniref:Uncharacterized protein n=1 Tax=Aureliella helgolandensis TaxID=2527968 RepID=A0A518GAK7_9BACT|nr:hypothetical protein Q31a_39190 [Aureliella helgolandensis]
MFLIGCRFRFLARLLAVWCLVLSLLGSSVHSQSLEDPACATHLTAFVTPVVEFSDTAVQPSTHLLAREHWQGRALAFSPSVLVIQSAFCQGRVLPAERHLPPPVSLLSLGVALRL